MEPGRAPEWLPDELTNKGLRVAAEPPTPEEARAKARTEADAKAGAKLHGAVPLEHVEHVVRERVAEIERRIESRLAAAVAEMKRALDRGDGRAPTPDLLGALDGNGDRPALDGEVDSRLREAERRVARAAQATERNVDEVRRILGARLAASRWVSDQDNGSGR
jgi:hypothetical protein